MTKEQLFDAIGGVEESYIRDAGEAKKKRTDWSTWAAVAACLVLVVCAVLWQVLPREQAPGPVAGDMPPMVEWDGRTYIVSGSTGFSSILPEGYVYAGTGEIDGEERELYTHPDQPLWDYVRQPWYSSDSEGKPSGMIYQRYVDENLRGKHFVRYNGQLYIRLIHGWMPPYEDVDSKLCDRIERTYGVSVTALPEGFVAVGEPVFTGDDTLPMVERGTNEPVEAIYANPDVPEILLTPTRNGYLVMILYTGPLA